MTHLHEDPTDAETTQRCTAAEPARAVSRREVLAGLGVLAGGGLLAGAEPAAAQVAGAAPGAAAPGAAAAKGAAPAKGPWRHSVGDPRGSDVAVAVGRTQEGRFGVMFKNLPAHSPPDDLLSRLAAQLAEPTGGSAANLDNPRVPSGFTFFGQFIDHDMTFDRTPMPQQQADPHALTNFDSPVFDLNSVYGGGPAADPQLYESDGRRLRVVRNVNGVEDLPRNPDGTAMVGDPRNDENLILSQLHLLFLKFHNRCLSSGLARSFAEAQRLTQWHFQWLIVHDYLPNIAGADVVARFLRSNGSGKPTVKREHYKPKNPNRPMMPIEYSVAAFRFGHSTVRPGYLLNERNGVPTGAPIFGADGADLRGSRPLPAAFEIDWSFFYQVPGAARGPRNHSRLIDVKLASSLFHLPSTVVSDAMVSLAQRNLIRGKRLGLPSGQQVAAAMGVKPLTNAELGLPDPDNAGWGGQAPLWFYILREAELQHGGQRLGAVGGRLVTEVILGILDAHKDSYFNAPRPFQPGPPIAPATGRFGMGDLVRFAQGG